MIDDCVFSDCTGNTVLLTSDSVLVQDCEFSNNNAGAMSLRGSGAIYSVFGCQIVNNTGDDIVLVTTEAGSLTEIDGCTIVGNTADTGGSVWYGEHGSHELRNSLILGNSAAAPTLGSGGVACFLLNASDSLRIENTVITGNSAVQASRRSGPRGSSSSGARSSETHRRRSVPV